MNSIKIKDRIISKNFTPFVIAEISANHSGSIEIAKQNILAAKKAGADAVKIQTYTPDTMTIKSRRKDFIIKDGLWSGNTLYDLYKKAYTPFEWHKELFDYSKKINIIIFSSPFDETAVDLLEKLNTPAYKIASFELTDLPLIKYIAKKKKPILMSTGMATIQEISEAIEVAKSYGCKQLGLFHCISSYPANIYEANLNSIKTLQREFKLQIGLSDHTLGNTAAIVATSLGITFIEKHFTISRKNKGPDSSFSIEPREMKKLILECKKAYSSLGNFNNKKISSNQKNKIFRRSLYFVKKLKKGELVKPEHIRRIRPGYGLPPKYFNDVIGSRVNSDVSSGERVTWNILE